MARTQEQRKAETRRRLLDAASDLFARKGFHAVSTEAVADAADRTSGAVYAHFGSKEGLLLALLGEQAAATGREIAGAVDDAATPTERLGALWSAVAGGSGSDDATERSDAWMLLEHELWLYAARSGEVDDALAARYDAGRTAMGDAFTAWAADDGEALPLPGDEVGTLVLALLFGLDMQRRVDPAAVPDRLAVDGLRLLFGRAPAGPGSRTRPPAPQGRHRKDRTRAHRDL